VKTVAAFISDRDPAWYLDACIESFAATPDAPMVTATRVVDDREHLLGMSGAVAEAWGWALDEHCDFLVHIEEDFLFRGFPITEMIRILTHQPHLAQVVLKRDPWSSDEREAGGQIEMNPGAYGQCWRGEDVWVEHDLLFSLNPCVIPRRTLELGAPVKEPEGFEAEFTKRCRKAGLRFAYYGAKEDPPLCEHVGVNRSGHGWSW
jgi:hypothetical protein